MLWYSPCHVVIVYERWSARSSAFARCLAWGHQRHMSCGIIDWRETNILTQRSFLRVCIFEITFYKVVVSPYLTQSKVWKSATRPVNYVFKLFVYRLSLEMLAINEHFSVLNKAFWTLATMTSSRPPKGHFGDIFAVWKTWPCSFGFEPVVVYSRGKHVTSWATITSGRSRRLRDMRKELRIILRVVVQTTIGNREDGNVF